MLTKQYFVYILFSKRNGTLYIGVTNDLKRRVYEHKNKLVQGFTAKYGVDKLGYFEIGEDIEAALLREKQLKKTNRKRKIALIESVNPEWRDLYDEI
ncbi:MAG: GIY-YIG nuclease family protein [Neisseriaceae bacterium]|nr:GIY-YIG nuclease family protein [Neisseriaceae bacterium]MBO7554600.1 GIY-YIG nuclease family protein [Neisseriaceae bacterium]